MERGLQAWIPRAALRGSQEGTWGGDVGMGARLILPSLWNTRAGAEDPTVY